MSRGAFALVTLLALTADARTGRFERTNSRTPQGRSERGFLGDSLAFLEFAPASGAGMGAVCACSAVTGAKGEALTLTRGSSATCTKTATGGLATSGIANGDLVTCSSNQPRVEYDSAGVLGLLVESARTNVLLRSDALTNLAWSDVGTPNATDGATDPFGGTTGDTLTDNDGAAFEGRSQAVTVTAATAYIMSCYLKGTTSAKARLSLDGTTCDTSTLSSTTWTLAKCADASSSGVSISAQVLVGNAVGDTGDIVVGGCQVEAGTYATSYMATAAASSARLAETSYLTLSSSMSQESMSLAYSVSQALPASGYTGDRIGAMTRALAGSGNFVAGYFQAQFRCDAVGTGSASALSGGTSVAGDRWACSHSASTTLAFKNGAQTATNTTANTMNAATVIGVGDSPAGTSHLDGIVSRVCADPSPSRCR